MAPVCHGTIDETKWWKDEQQITSFPQAAPYQSQTDKKGIMCNSFGHVNINIIRYMHCQKFILFGYLYLFANHY